MNQYERAGDLQEALQIKIETDRAQLWTAFPARVISYDPVKNVCQLQPMFMGVAVALDGSASNIKMPVLPDCPVVFPCGGGYHLTFPIQANDEMLVIVSCRNIDPWWGTGEGNPAMEFRMHDLSDCFCIPGPRSRNKVITNISTSAAQWRNDTGDAYIEIRNKQINIVTPSTVNITAQGNANVTAPLTTFNGNVRITGNLQVDSNFTATGTGTIGTIDFNTHRHSDPQGGNTGPPFS